ncbi:MAG: non-ribosomal peptide synthetase, partial [Nitrosomonas sp. PRO4]|nr:non-ribosomal peptide synthetase [Nitrosomonas sp. PRO4]
MKKSNDLEQRRARLTPEQRKKLAQRIRSNRHTLQQYTLISHRPDAEAAPLSYAQQRHWFLWQLDPQSTAYHLNASMQLDGELNSSALHASFQTLVQRHEALRTVFRADANGMPEQIIDPEGNFKLLTIDLCDLPQSLWQQRIEHETMKLNTMPFDLTTGPLLRVALIRLTAIKHYLIVVMHHIISDAWSNRIIIDEFATCYRAHQAGQQPQLSQMMVQYADFAIWQRNWLDAGEKERQVSYWRKQLGAMNPVLQLPSDFPRSSLGNYTAAHYDFQLPDSMAVDLRKWVQDRNVTLFMATLCGFQMLLHRYSGQNDIRVGIPTANRHYAGVENIVGLFVNTQVLRINIDNRATLIDLMELTRDVALGAQAHQDLPFEQLVEALQPERNLNQNPLFQVMFNYMREDYRMLMQLPGLTVREYQLDEQGAQFELMLDIVEKPNGVISARFTYASELFKPASIERMGKLYLSLLNDLLQNPRRTIGEVSLVTVEEWQQLKEWGICERRNDIIEPVHTWIEAQAKERPDA